MPIKFKLKLKITTQFKTDVPNLVNILEKN